MKPEVFVGQKGSDRIELLCEGFRLVYYRNEARIFRSSISIDKQVLSEIKIPDDVLGETRRRACGILFRGRDPYQLDLFPK